MSNPSSQPRVPAYLKVPAPWSFRMRPDLLDELCLQDVAAYQLPHDEASYWRYLRVSGADETSCPYSGLRALCAHPFAANGRCIFSSVLLVGSLNPSVLARDASGRVLLLEPQGLSASILDRAIEFAVHNQVQPGIARMSLISTGSTTPSDKRFPAKWTVGYDAGASCCILLVRDTEGEKRFMEGKKVEAVRFQFWPQA